MRIIKWVQAVLVQALESRTLLSADLVRDIHPTGSSGPWDLVEMAGRLFFSADDGAHGRELWTSDGTSAGTRMIKDAVPGDVGSNPRTITPTASALYYVAHNAAGREELWTSDGTSAGTRLVKSFSGIGFDARNLLAVNTRLFFTLNSFDNGIELWTSDGTTLGTRMVRDLRPGWDHSNPTSLTQFKGMVYFAARADPYGVELWKSDGTAFGTTLVKDINPTTGSGPRCLLATDDAVYFVSSDGSSSSPSLWRTDGSSTGTLRVSRVAPQCHSGSGMVNVDGNIYFSAYVNTPDLLGIELWRSDGTESGTQPVADINPGPNSSEPHRLAALNGMLFFSAVDRQNGRRLWRSDGTMAGTQLIYSNPLIVDLPRAIHGLLYFIGDDGSHGRQLWRSDGTAEGTRMVTDFNPTWIAGVGEKVFVAASELWTTRPPATLLSNEVIVYGEGTSESILITESGGRVTASHGGEKASFPTRYVASLRLRGGSGASAFDMVGGLSVPVILEATEGEHWLNLTGGRNMLDASASDGRFSLEVATAAVEITNGLEFGTLTVGSDARISLSSPGKSMMALQDLSLSPHGYLDLRGNDLIVDRPAQLAAVTAAIASARNAGTGLWTGPGLTSSAAAADPLTTLAIGLLGDDIVVKHTYNGDANLDEVVNADDYFRIDSAFLAQPQDPRFDQGDFNYDNAINADDYFLIDSAFLSQPPPAAAATAVWPARSATDPIVAPAEESRPKKRQRPLSVAADRLSTLRRQRPRHRPQR